MAVAMVGAVPAQATHPLPPPGCTTVPPTASSAGRCGTGFVTVAILEGLGSVCGAVVATCDYHWDEIWSDNGTRPKRTDGSPRGPLGEGFYWPGFGPPAVSPFTFNASPGTPGSFLCVSTIAGPNCTFNSSGTVAEGLDDTSVGGYCGASRGNGTSTFSSGVNPVTGTSLVSVATFGWRQSAATILPLEGKVTSTTPSGGAGATVIGFTSSRGTAGAGENCGITKQTTGFQVEGMIVTF
jgi:hypothetical protein